jgi:peptidyl-prolyl cis-trans isomerase SurA
MQKPDGPSAAPVKLTKTPATASQPGGIKPTVFEAIPAAFPTPANAEESVRVRAHVNGVPILHDEIQQLIQPSLMKISPLVSESERKAQQEKIFQDGVAQVIDRELIIQDMEARLTRNNGKQYLNKLREHAAKEFEKTLRQMRQASGVKSDDEFKALLQQQGQSLEGARRQFERNLMAREYMKGMVFPRIERWTTHQEIVDYYREHPAEFQQHDGVKWNDIFIDAAKYRSREEARAVAEQIANRARSGEPFAQLLKYDNGDASYRNGEGLGERRGEIKPVEAENMLFTMKDGEVRVLELGNGYHVVQLTKRQHAGLVPFDDKAQDLIRKKLQMQVAEKEMKRFVDDLKQKALIEIEPSGS